MERKHLEAYKEARSFKGFEVWWHSVQMTLKMYITTFLIVFFLHLFLTFIFIFLFRFEDLKIVFLAFTTFSPHLWIKAVFYLIKISILFFILCSPVWLAFPIFLRKYKTKAEKITRDEHLRGAKVVSEDELKQIIEKDLKEKKEGLLTIGKIPIPGQAEVRHFFIIGRSGTGKTRLIYSFISQLRERKNKAIIYDFKGDFISCFYDPSRDLIFNPLDKRTVHWCVLREIETFADVDSVSMSLIPSSMRDDKFWVDAARDVFSSILFYLKYTKQETNQHLWHYCSLSEEDMLNQTIIAVSQGVEIAKRALGYLLGYEKGSKVASDVLSTMKQYTNCFFYTSHLGNTFSLKQWVEEGEGFLFIVGFPKLRDTLRPLLSLFIDVAIKHALSLPEDNKRRIFFILDEFSTLQKLSATLSCLEQGRSKGLSLVLALQDFNQLERIYHEAAFSILNNCSTIISFALNDPKSQETMAKVYGEAEILETDETLAMGVEDVKDGLSLVRRRKLEKVILPSEFAYLKDLQAYLKILSYPTSKVKIPFVSFPVQANTIELEDRFVF
ncbi:MAG: type IV secretion system DNA-binding domain-containing protein [Brevinematia bacterium]